MAELISGDTTKGIKSVGELSLRISKFDSYRLFTLYENVKEGKVMNISGNQKYYLVFKSPHKEIRIPEYDTKGDFEVDKVNGCILFKITKKNAADIISMKGSGDRIFYIVRVYEDKDIYGNVLGVSDEVEVYNGRWGEDADFNTFTTEKKVDLLTKSVAVQVDKNSKLFAQYIELLKKYNDAIDKISKLEKEMEILRAERDTLQAIVDEYTGNTYDGTLLSTDTKYIAFENTLDNISFTEEQYNDAMNDLMTKGEVNLENYDLDDPRIELKVNIYQDIKDAIINVYQNNISVGSAIYNQGLYKTVYINHDDIFRFECKGVHSGLMKSLKLKFSPVGVVDNNGENKYSQSVVINTSGVLINGDKTTIEGKINFNKYVLDDNGDKIVDDNGEYVTEDINPVGNIGEIYCYIDDTNTINI